MYKYEMHLHSCACSACGVSDSVEMVLAAKEKCYAGVVFTNHFYHGNTCIDRNLVWKDFVEAYKQDYLKAKECGDKLGVKVFFGVEEGIGKGKEVLIYGLDADIIANESDFKNMDIKALSDFVHKNGGVLYAAHPFRDRPYIIDPKDESNIKYLDGIEVFNCGNTKEVNEYTADYANSTGIATISGGDVHFAQNFGNTGIATEFPIKTNEELVKVLKERKHRIIINGEII